MDTQKIGKFIAAKRKEKKLTQAQMGELLGVASKSISKWENGVYMPDLSLLVPISEILEITLNELLAGESLSKEEAAEQTENSIVAAIDYSNKKMRKLRNRYTCFIVAVVISFLFIFTVLHGFLFAEVSYVQGNTSQWENYFPQHSAYKMGVDEERKPVFLNPDVAMKKAQSDYSDAILLIKEKYQLLPFSKYTYKFYLPHLSELETEDEFVNVQLDGLRQFVRIYENSFQRRNNMNTEERSMVGLMMVGVGIFLMVYLFCTQGFDVMGYLFYQGKLKGIITREEAFTVSKSRRLVEKKNGEEYEAILSTQDRSVHYFPFAFYGKTQAILEWNAEDVKWRARYPYLRKRGEWAIGEEIEIRYSKKRPWRYAVCDGHMWVMFFIKMLCCIGCCVIGAVIFIGSI